MFVTCIQLGCIFLKTNDSYRKQINKIIILECKALTLYTPLSIRLKRFWLTKITNEQECFYRVQSWTIAWNGFSGIKRLLPDPHFTIKH
jgi:hypothetical protein